MSNWLLKNEFQMEAMGDSTAQEPDGIWSEIDEWRSKVFEKPPSNGLYLQRWRKASIAIAVCNRMRLVLESSHPVDKAKQKQTAINAPLTVQRLSEINSLLTVPLTVQQLNEINNHVTVSTLDAASSQAQSSDTYFGWQISTEERHASEIFLAKFHIVRHSMTDDGLLSIAVESKGPIIPENFLQVVGKLHSLFEGPQHPGSVNPLPVTVPSPNRDVLDWLPDINEGEDFGSRGEFLGSSSNSATGMIFNMDEDNPLTPESTVSVHLWEHDYHPLVPDYLAPSMTNPGTVTYSDSVSMLDGVDGMESRQFDQILEAPECCDVDQALKKLRNDPLWEKHIEMMRRDITQKFEDIDHASDRNKLNNVKLEVDKIRLRLSREVETFEGHLTRFWEQISTTAKRHSNSGPNIQQLTKAITLDIKRFKEKEWKHLLDETRKISERLQRVFKELKDREGSAMKVFQSCAESLTLLFQSLLEENSQKFIWVPDFRDWHKEVHSLHHFYLDGRSR